MLQIILINILVSENPKVKDYYKKYVTNKKEEQLIKERTLSMTREEYKKMMLYQME